MPIEPSANDANLELAPAVQASPFHTVVLVEGDSDRLAVESLARRRDRVLSDERVSVVSMGGARNIGRYVDRFGPQGLGLRLAGLCDAAEEPDFRRSLELAGLGTHLGRHDMERLGFFVCVEDLEDELIRALGAATVLQVVDEMGDLGSFRTFQKQPWWRGRPREEQLRRFLGTHSGRKIRSAPLLVERLDPERIPRPLARLLDHV